MGCGTCKWTIKKRKERKSRIQRFYPSIIHWLCAQTTGSLTQHIQIDSLFTHVPVYTDKKGKTSWTKVVDAIKRDTGRPFGAGTTSKKWTDLIKTRANQSSALAQHAHDGEEGCEAEENESSPSCFEAVDNNSEEDLPSHKFFFQEADDEDDKASEFAAVKLQCPQVWH